MIELGFRKTLILIAAFIVPLLAGCGGVEVPVSQASTNKTKHGLEAIQVDDAVARQLDIKTELVEKKTLGHSLRITGQIKPVVGQEAEINTRFSGRVVRVLAKLGEVVKPGQDLAFVDSSDMGDIQAELIESKSKVEITKAQASREKQIYNENFQRPSGLIQAQTALEEAKVQLDLADAEYKRMEGLHKEKIAAGKDFLAARAALESSKLTYREAVSQCKREEGIYKNTSSLKHDLHMALSEATREEDHLHTLIQRLDSLGMPRDMINKVLKTNKIIPVLPLRASSCGVVTKQELAVGEMLGPSDTAMVVTDLSTVLVSADLPEADLASVTIGCPVTVKVASYPNEEFHGVVSYVSEHVEPETRTVAIRAKLDNKERKLKLNMFAEIKFQAAPRLVIACPKSAAQERDGQKVVFVKTKEGYKERPVVLVPGSEQYYEVTSGLTPGEEIVTQGSLLLKAELSSNR